MVVASEVLVVAASSREMVLKTGKRVWKSVSGKVSPSEWLDQQQNIRRM